MDDEGTEELGADAETQPSSTSASRASRSRPSPAAGPREPAPGIAAHSSPELGRRPLRRLDRLGPAGASRSKRRLQTFLAWESGEGGHTKTGTWLTPRHRTSPSRSGSPPFPPASPHGRPVATRASALLLPQPLGWHLLDSFVGAFHRAGSDERPPRPAPPKPTPSPRAFRAPAAGADSPCTPAPSPTSTAGKNQVGGRGKAGAAGQIAVAQPTSAARWGL